MIKNKFGIVAALLIITSNYAFALEKTETCNYPQHFKIEGPTGTSILKVETFPNATISVIQTSESSFDVIDNSGCDGTGRRSVQLNVGTDKFHFSERIFVSHNDGTILFIQTDDLNFRLSSIERTSSTETKFIYENM